MLMGRSSPIEAIDNQGCPRAILREYDAVQSFSETVLLDARFRKHIHYISSNS